MLLLFSSTVDSDFIQGVKNVFGSKEKKELVDPYFVFSFAGQEVSYSSRLIHFSAGDNTNYDLGFCRSNPKLCTTQKTQSSTKNCVLG